MTKTMCPKCKKGYLSTDFDVPEKTRAENEKAGFVVQKCHGVTDAGGLFIFISALKGCGYTVETPIKKRAR